jgi:uncharacterized protein YdeI (YjbR/CyaY-like superfamily)
VKRSEANPRVSEFIARSDRWRAEMEAVRPTLLDCGLDEEVKWGKPCYSHEGHNVVILQPMKELLSVMFFKGVVLSDPTGVLTEQGPNSHAARRIVITSVDDAERVVPTLRDLVGEAIETADVGLAVPPRPQPTLAPEFVARLASDPKLAAAFERLTPGRQREMQLFIAAAKKSATRESRVDKCVSQILAGKGLRDR